MRDGTGQAKSLSYEAHNFNLRENYSVCTLRRGDDNERWSAMKRAILPFALLLIPISISAQENPCLRRVLPVSVVGRDEVPVAGLTAENFRGSFQGAPVRVLSVTWNAGPRRTVVLLDLSGSMGGKRDYALPSKSKAIELLASYVLQSGRSDSEFALLTFADEVIQITPLSPDRQPAIDWVGKIPRDERKLFKGRTSLFDAIGKAAAMLSPPQPGDAIYLISDGGNNSSRIGANEIEAKLISAGVRLFAFFVVDADPRLQFGDYDESMRTVEIVRRTGGMAFVLRSPTWKPKADYNLSEEGRKNIREIANSLFQQMEKFYKLEIELPEVVNKPRTWKLELIPNSNLQVKGLSLHAPMKLVPCTTAK